jgi:hypothetical protein
MQDIYEEYDREEMVVFSLSPSLLKHLVLKCIEIMVVIGVVGFVHLLYNVFYVNTDGI